MKRWMSILTALLICLSLAVPAFAAEVDYVPSITAKPAPELDGTGADADGLPVIEVKDENKEVVHTSPVQHLFITSVAEVMGDDPVAISEEKVEALKEAYTVLDDPDLNIFELVPELAEIVEAGVKEMVVMDLFDVTIVNEELEQHLNKDGHTIELTFDVNVPADQAVYVMVFKENKWQLIESAVNNGDGTVTCVFEHFCPVAILTVPPVVAEETEPATEAAAEPEAPAQTQPQTPAVQEEAPAGSFPWWIILIVIVVAVLIPVLKSKKKK